VAIKKLLCSNEICMVSSAANSGRGMAYNNLSGHDFDRKWVSDMIMGHTKPMNELKNELGKNAKYLY
jgi:hypothetical protein